MAGWKQWISGEVVNHDDLQSYIQNQVVQVYAGTAARGSVIGTALTEGMVTYLTDTNALQYYDGSAWLTLDTGTDPAIFTAGVSGQLLSSLGTAGVAWLNQGSVVAGSASYAGSADFATNAGTAIYATNAGTAVGLSGTIAANQVTGTAVTQADTGTVTNTMLAGLIANDKLTNSTITLNGTAVPLGGSATISGGGTAGGFDNPMTNLGDLIVGGTAGIAQRLGIGTSGQLLTTNGTTASWSSSLNGTLTANGLVASRVNTSDEGGQIDLNRASDNAIAWSIDVFGSTSTPDLRFIQGGTANIASFNSTGQLTANAATPGTANTAKAIGYIGMPQVALSSGGTTIAAAHAGDHIYNTSGGTVTIPSNSTLPLEVGTTVVVVNGNNTSTIAITSDTLRQAGTSNTGTRTLAAYGVATLIKVASTTWYISGNGVS